jgi:hypothetical protein
MMFIILARGGLFNGPFTELAIVLIGLFFAVVKHLFEASKEATKKRALQAGKPPQPINPNAAQQPPAPAGGQQADSLRSQVEEFLRRSQNAAAANPPQPSQPPQSLAAQSEAIANERLRAMGRRAAPDQPSPPAKAEPQQRTPRRSRRRQSIAEHVEEQVAARSKNIARQASRLGNRISNEDKQFDDQVKAKFDHTLGTLAETTAAPTATPSTAAAANDTPARQIAALLANPEGIRQAIVVNEIMRRPYDRW